MSRMARLKPASRASMRAGSDFMKDRSVTARLGRVEYIRFKVHPEEEPRFLQDYRLAATRLEACDACLAYELCRSDEPGHLFMRIEWDASAAAWSRTEQPAEVMSFLLGLKTALKNMCEVKAYEQVLTSVAGTVPIGPRAVQAPVAKRRQA